MHRILLHDVVGSMLALGRSILGGGADIDSEWANSASHYTVATLLLVFVFPISLNRSLGGLSFVTPLSLGSVMVLLITVCIRGSVHAYTQWDTLVYHLWPQTYLGVLKALPIFSKCEI